MNRKRRRVESKRSRGTSHAGPTRTPTLSSAIDAFAEAARLAKFGRSAEAMRLYQATIAAYPDHAYSLLMNGIAALRAGRKDEAIGLLMRAAGREEQDVDFHNNLGNALAEVGHREAACVEYERAIRLKPDSAEAHYNLANTYAALYSFEAAIVAYKKALSLRPNYVDAHINLGNLLAQLDRLDEATVHFEAAIAHQPNNAKARNNLAFILNTAERYDEAKVHLERALAIEPRYPHAQNNLGNVHLAQGSPVQAITFYRAALALEPNYVNAINNLGTALSQLGRYDEALAQLERALSLSPESAPVNNSLGIVLQKLGRLTEAVACFERAVTFDPNYTEAWTNLAANCNDRELHEKAVIYCDRALAIDPNSTEAHNNRGIALVALDRFDEAMSSYDRALACDSNLADVHCNIGSALVERGRTEEALLRFARAIELSPERPKFHLCHILTKPITPGDARLATLEAMTADLAVMPYEARIDLHFALAKAYADIGDHSRSFAQLLAGNQLKRKSVEYDEAQTIGYLDQVPAAWPRQVVDAWSGMGNPSDRPVFILGMPRSGSTLVEQILASHPAVAAGGEMRQFEQARTTALGSAETFTPGLWPADKRTPLLAEIADIYLQAIEGVGHGATRVTDKTPGNFSYVGLIRLALPNARIIHTRRNPLDICLSCFSSLFTSVPFSYDLGEVGRYYRAYERLMRHWHSVLPESAILDVDYELLVSDFEAQARRIIAYCGLPWDDACLSFHTTERRVKTASAVQVRKPLYNTSVDRWRAIDAELLAPLRAALDESDGPQG